MRNTLATRPLFELSNVAIHAHLLPTGKILYWGRRSKPGDTSFDSLNEQMKSEIASAPESDEL